MLFFGYFLLAVVSAMAGWGAVFWLMARSVNPAGSRLKSAEEERTRTIRGNAIYEDEWNYQRAA